MIDSELEDNINVAIMKDDLKDFINCVSNLQDWKEYFVNDFEEYFIHAAIRNKASKILNYMFDQKIDLNVKNGNFKTPLHLAIEEGMCEYINKIITNVAKNVTIDK